MSTQALEGFTVLVAMKFGLQVMHVILNLLVLRNINQDDYGYTLHLDLYLNLTLFYIKSCLKNCY
jgi:hypothetical protein